MLIECEVSIKEILKKGKSFPWKKPSICPCCNDTALWGHGSTLCYFSNICSGVYLKRYRCNSCKSVIKLKPAGFFKNFRTPTNIIKDCLTANIVKKRINPTVPRNNQNYWLRNLKKNVRVILGEEWKHRLLEGFEKLLLIGKLPVSCSIRNI